MRTSLLTGTRRSLFFVRHATQGAVILAIVASGAVTLHATPADPQGVFDNVIVGVPTPVTDFGFGSDLSGGGYLSFQNVSGNDWVGMQIFVDQPAGIAITCGGGPYFGSCTTSYNATTGLYDMLFTDPLNGGIPNNATFSFDLNNPGPYGPNRDPNGAGGWGNDADFNAVPANAPEPASWLLFAAGLALFALTSRRLTTRTR